MLIGLIDLDKKGDKPFPNLTLMQLSSYHKNNGDIVKWYNKSDHFDIIYITKVFSFTDDIETPLNAEIVYKFGSGYDIEIKNGKEIYVSKNKPSVLNEIRSVYPDYELYGITDTAYGFMQIGCPRACDFCHIKDMQGKTPTKVNDLKNFWKGQKNIVLLDPNITACPDRIDLLNQLINSGSYVDFTQGIDVRTLTPEIISLLSKIKIKHIHFAWDNMKDSEIIYKKLEMVSNITKWGRNKISVYVLTNFNTTIEEDLYRIYKIRSLNFQPYVMRYDKENIKRGDVHNAIARWVNFPALFWKYNTFEDYVKYNR